LDLSSFQGTAIREVIIITPLDEIEEIFSIEIELFSQGANSQKKVGPNVVIAKLGKRDFERFWTSGKLS